MPAGQRANDLDFVEDLFAEHRRPRDPWKMGSVSIGSSVPAGIASFKSIFGRIFFIQSLCLVVLGNSDDRSGLTS